MANETGYELQWAVPSGQWNSLPIQQANTTSYSHTGLSANTTYLYRVRAANGAGQSAWAGPVSATTSSPSLPPPSNVVAVATSASDIDVRWSDAANETGYELEWAPASGGPWNPLAVVAQNATSRSHSGLTANTTYWYRIRAVYGSSYSAWAGPVWATTSSPSLPPPSNVVAVATSASDIDVRWSDAANETGYELEWAPASGGPWNPLAVVAQNATSRSHSGLTANTTYWYRIRAVYGSSYSAWAGPVWATTSSPSLPPPTNVVAVATSASDIDVRWSDAANDTGYELEWANTSTGPWNPLAVVAQNATSRSHSGLTANTTYWYRIRALYGTSYSQWAGPVSATTSGPTPQCTLTLVASPSSGGTVAFINGSTATGNCPRQVEIAATAAAAPAPGWVFREWNDGSSSNPSNPFSIYLGLNTTMTGRFDPRIALNVVGSGSVSPSGTSVCSYGTTLNPTASPAAGWTFAGWTENGQAVSPPFLCDRPRDIVATFTSGPTPQCTLTLVASPSSGGTVAFINGSTATGNCPRQVSIEATAAASPAPGWAFRDWNDGSSSNPSNPFSIYLGLNTTMTGRFDPRVTLSVVGSGSISPSGTTVCTYGTTLNPTASPAAGWTFAGWTENGQAVSPPFLCDRPRNVVATFTGGQPDLYPINISGVPSQVFQGDSIRGFAFTFGNKGQADASANWYVQPYLSADAQITSADNRLPVWGGWWSGNPNQIPGYPVRAKTAVNTSGVGLIVPANTPPGTYFIGIILDDGQTEAESDEANNWIASGTALQVLPRPCTLTLQPATGGTVSLAGGSSLTGSCGRSVTVQATASPGYSFSGWSDGTAASVNPYTFTLNADKPLGGTFTVVPAQCTLTLQPATGGTVSLAAGSSLTGSCGRSVTVQATASSGYSFSGWSDGTAASVNPYTFTLNADKTLGGTFTVIPPTCTLTLQQSNGGALALASGSLTGNCGRSVTVQATASSGYSFSGWSDGTAASVNPYTFTLNADKPLGGTFTVIPPTCTLTLQQSNGGVLALASGSLTGNCGRSVTVQATASSGYSFSGWSDGTAASVNPYTFTLNADKTLGGTFTVIPPTCTLTLQQSNGGALALASGSLTGNCGRSVTVQATASSGYSFSGWSDGTAASVNPYTFTLNADKPLGGTFTVIPPTCTLTLQQSNGGVLALASGSLTGNCGRSVTVQATASSGYSFSGWSDGTPPSVNPYSLTIGNNRTLQGLFAQSFSADAVITKLTDLLLGRPSSLSQEEIIYCDRQGNNNGVVDLGDLIALVERNPSARVSPNILREILANPAAQRVRIPVPEVKQQ